MNSSPQRAVDRDYKNKIGMKRGNSETGSSGAGEAGTAMKGKKKMMEAEEQDAGDDELLAALGYKVRSSEMADVAQKLEQLEMAMAVGGSGADDDDALISHLASDTVHYNPSDLSSWLESMLSELNAPPPPPPPYNPNPRQPHHNFGLPPPNIADAFMEPSVITTVDFPQYDLKPPPAAVDANIYGPDGRKAPKGTKRTRTSSSPPKGGASAAASPTTEVSSMMPGVVVADSQEAGIRLVHALMACAEAVQQENLKAADVLVKQISLLAPSQGGAMRKVAGYFAEALARRIYHLNPQQDSSLDSAFSDILESHFYDSCPYLKFAHFTANQAILEAFAGCRRVHVIDFGMKQGMQWPALMQALALRPGGPPSFRLTGIGPPQPGNTDSLQQVGWKLAQFADTVGVAFEYRGFVASSLADLEPYMFEMPPGEEPVAVAVNSVFEMHRLLAQQGAVEKVLGTVRAIKPRIMTVVEQESNHNAGRFVDRFGEALHYYSTMFDSLEGGAAEQQQDQVMSEVYLGRQMCNVLACEGADRTERHETLAQWRARFGSAGFEPVPLGSNAFKQASMLLALFAGADGYQVEEREGGLTLGWHTRPLIATSAWRVVGSCAAAAAASV